MRINSPKLYYGLFAIISALYISTIFLFEPSPAALARYHVTELQLKLISLALIVPIILIWLAGFVGLVNLKKYAQKIKGTRDGKGFAYLAAGVTVFGVTVAVNGLLERVLNYAAQRHVISGAAATITHTEFAIFANLIAFALIFMGAKWLVHTLRNNIDKSNLVAAAIALVAISVPYIIAVFIDPARGMSLVSADKHGYGMPDWLVVLAVVVPYVLTWGFGLFATALLVTYNQHVKGEIYRSALKRLTRGFFIILVVTIVLQFLSAASSILSSWGLNAILSLLYVLLFVITVGFLYIARGAKSLTKLEEVT